MTAIAAGADVVLDLPRGGKVEAQNAAVAEARGEILAFSDANTLWEPDALRHLVAAIAEPGVGYVCGRLRLTGDQHRPVGRGRHLRRHARRAALTSGQRRPGAGNPRLPFRIAAYYVTVTASIAAGLFDRIRHGPAKTWDPVEGTR